MEAYPDHYTEHNLPLVVLSGLGEQENVTSPGAILPHQESGTKIQFASPECSGERADSLRQQLLQLDGSNLPWNASLLPAPSGLLGYKMKAIGRAYTLPARKAAPAPQSPSTEGVPSLVKTELHSPLSPLSPGSPLFPDGVFTPLWLAKHQGQVPALLLAFFSISAYDSQDKDEKLKADINAVRAALSRSGFKTRFAVVLLSDQSILQAPELEERLSSVRRLTSLDSKTGLFFMPPMSSQGEIATFVHSLMTTLQPLCIEHYRELTKHARRKKAKGSPAPTVTLPIGGGQSLSTPGWNVRYEVKQGVFAEFRQEMEVAERHYSASIHELFSSEGIFEATANWSPSWEEARLLCDCLALRVLRCQLWVSSTTGAVQSWVNYKARMKDLVDRRGKGSATYGWDAWESRWSEIMAQLIQRADLPSLQKSALKALGESVELAPQQIYALPEKTFAAAERLPPFHSLHHPGYWHKLAVQGSRARRKKALAIPEEDQVPPGQSPASTVANRSRNYDSYLVPAPHQEFALSKSASNGALVGATTKLGRKAVEHFQERGQTRASELIELELAQDLVDVGRHENAIQILTPILERTSWRDEDWHDIFAELLLLLRHCAHRLAIGAVTVATTYELLGIRSLPMSTTIDLHRCLEDLNLVISDDTQPVSLKFKDKQRLSPVALSFAFADRETHVGEALECQLTVAACACQNSQPLTLSTITLAIGSKKTVEVAHESDSSNASPDLIDLGDVSEHSDGSFRTKADLEFHPGQSRAFSFHVTFREAETLQLGQASISINSEKFNIEHTFAGEALLRSDAILIRTSSGSLNKRFLPHPETDSVTVLPKPPKVKVLVHGLRQEYYTDELVRLSVELVNAEVEAVEGNVSAKSEAGEQEALSLQWKEQDVATETDGFSWPSPSTSASHTLSQLESGSSQTMVLLVKAPTDATKTTIAIDAEYALTTEESTPLRKTLTLELHFIVPLDATFNFGPLLYREAWPSYFDPKASSTKDQPGGIPQLWRLSSTVRSLAAEAVLLHKITTVVDDVLGGSIADVLTTKPMEKQSLEPRQTEPFSFELLTQKHSLDDRRPTTVEATLAIVWSRDENSEHTTTHIPIPRLTLPVMEPRVLCTLAETHPTDGCDAIIQYHIENPSTHFLTFAVTMEATEDFAFSGPKYRTLSLAPLSRHKVDFQLALQDLDDSQASDKEEGHWIWPSLQVVDSYYQKTLRVHPGGAGVKADDQQNIGVLVKAA
ncbi:hypothetical protein LTR37_013956 [Vermiconidia calcicola]|uniref:Uncharacterized protein n=1 Tax=Vermiconidia calcicola TaxID=1690605 RepID=A0ACC3MWF9_9PEZI|nr:hypothetical protein LTR37_013956 [Vermiconidia calcicola]